MAILKIRLEETNKQKELEETEGYYFLSIKLGKIKNENI